MASTRLRGRALQLATLAILGAMGAFVWAVYEEHTASNTAYLVRRNNRVLTTLASATKQCVSARATRLARDAALLRDLLAESPTGRDQAAGATAEGQEDREGQDHPEGTLVGRLQASRRAEPEVLRWTAPALTDLDAGCISARFESVGMTLALLDHCGGTVLAEETVDLQASLEPFLIAGAFDMVVVLAEDPPKRTDDSASGEKAASASAVSKARVVAVLPNAAPLRRLTTWEALSVSNASLQAPPSGNGAVETPDDMVIAGDRYRRFTLPVDVFVDPVIVRAKEGRRRELSRTGPVRLWVHGLVATDRFKSDARAWSALAVFLFTALPVLGILAWPVIDFFVPEPTDRWPNSRIAWLGVSLIVASCVVTLSFLALAHYAVFRRSLDQKLDSLASQVSGRFHGDLSRALGGISGKLAAATKELPTSGAGVVPLSARTQLLVRQGGPTVDPVTILALADDKGQQRVKWTYVKDPASAFPAPLQDVSLRDYFKRVMYDSESLSSLGVRRFALEPVWSMTSGHFQPTLAERLEKGKGSLGADVLVAALALPSVQEPVLPLGFGFAVIDDDGTVRYHSESAHTLSENLFEELEDPARLRMALPARRPERFSGRYWGAKRQFLVQSLSASSTPNGPLEVQVNGAVVAFADLESAHLRELEILYATAWCWILAIGVGVLMVTVLVGWARPGPAWIAPRLCFTRTYPWLALTQASAAILVILVGAAGGPHEVALFSVPVAALLAGLFCVVIAAWRLGEQEKPGRRSQWLAISITFLPGILGLGALGVSVTRSRADWLAGSILLLGMTAGALLAHRASVGISVLQGGGGQMSSSASQQWTLWAASMIAVLGVAPVLAVYARTASQERLLAQRHEATELLCRAEERKRALGQGGGDDRLAMVYDTMAWGTPAEAGDANTGIGLAGLRALAASIQPATEGPFDWTLGSQRAGLRSKVTSADRCPQLIADLEKTPTANQGKPGRGLDPAPSEVLAAQAGETTVGAVPLIAVLTLLGAVGMAGLLSALYRRLTAANAILAEEPALLDLELAVDRHMFVVCPLLGPRAAVLRKVGDQRIDVDTPAGVDALRAYASRNETRMEGRSTAPGEILCVDRIERALIHPTRGPEILDLLEGLLGSWSLGTDSSNTLVSHGATTIVLLSEQPSEDLAGGGDPTSLRWRRLFARFEARHVPVISPQHQGTTLAPKPTFEAKLAKEFEAADADWRRVLARECHGNKRLRDIARGLLREGIAPDVAPGRAGALVGERAVSFYQAIWAAASSAEQVVLANVAAGDVLNPRLAEALRSVRRRGLVRIEAGEPRLFNDGFAEFVRGSGWPSVERAEARSDAAGPWHAVRGLVALGLGAAAIFVVVTQRSGALALLGLLNALVPLLTKVGDMVRSQAAGERKA